MSWTDPPSPLPADTVTFEVYGKNRTELREAALNDLTKLLGVRPENPTFTLDISPQISAQQGGVVTWKATVHARIPHERPPR